MARIRRVRDDGDLRMLAVESTVVLGVATGAAYPERGQILRALTGLIDHRHLYAFSPDSLHGGRIALLTGILVSLPVLAYLVAAYTLPTTGPLDPMLLAVPVLCVLGAVIGWVAVLPAVVRATGYDTNAIHYLPTIQGYVNVTLGTLAASAAALGGAGMVILTRAG